MTATSRSITTIFALSFALSFAGSPVCSGQIGNSSNLFPSIADSQNKVDAVQDRLKNDPPADQAYTEYNATMIAMSQAQNTIDDLKKQLTLADTLSGAFNNELGLLSKQAEICPKDTKLPIGILTPKGADGFPLDFNAREDFNEFDEAYQTLSMMSGPSLCAKVKDLAAHGGGDLSIALNNSINKYKSRLNSELTYTGKLIDLFKEHASKLQTKMQGQKANSVLASQLPLLVGIVCLFSLIILGLLKFIGNELIQMELVKSGQIIQFPMVMILLVVIISLGMSDKLSESSLSALLGGLAGYVLSQGVGSMASQRARVAVMPTQSDGGGTLQAGIPVGGGVGGIQTDPEKNING